MGLSVRKSGVLTHRFLFFDTSVCFFRCADTLFLRKAKNQNKFYAKSNFKNKSIKYAFRFFFKNKEPV